MGSQLLEERTENSSIYGSLRPEIKDNLNNYQEDLIRRLDSFEAPYLQEKLLADGKFETPEEYKEAFTEFKKYVALTQLTGEKGLSMTSPKVDEVWHQFILFTPQYHKFCEEFLGKYMHHLPKTSHTPLNPNGRTNLIQNYRNMYGEIPEVWGIKSETCTDICTDPDCEPCSSEGCNVDPDPD